jgi:RNA polymerase sigma-70 factor (sigma-E family)
VWQVRDDTEYTAFVAARWAPLVRTSVLLGCSRAEAEDLVQTALVRCYTSWPRVRSAADVDAYVHRILVNCLAKSRRRRWWGERPTDAGVIADHGRSDDVADDAAVRHAVGTALARLSREHRTVVVLRFFADLSERQVADVLGVPPGTVKSRTARALDRLSADESLSELHRP